MQMTKRISHITIYVMSESPKTKLSIKIKQNSIRSQKSNLSNQNQTKTQHMWLYVKQRMRGLSKHKKKISKTRNQFKKTRIIHKKLTGDIRQLSQKFRDSQWPRNGSPVNGLAINRRTISLCSTFHFRMDFRWWMTMEMQRIV